MQQQEQQHEKMREGLGSAEESGKQNKWYPSQMLKNEKHTSLLSLSYGAREGHNAANPVVF